MSEFLGGALDGGADEADRAAGAAARRLAPRFAVVATRLRSAATDGRPFDSSCSSRHLAAAVPSLWGFAILRRPRGHFFCRRQAPICTRVPREGEDGTLRLIVMSLQMEDTKLELFFVIFFILIFFILMSLGPIVDFLTRPPSQRGAELVEEAVADLRVRRRHIKKG
jgi:hypothetical protein